jgi:hypothetical protein
VDTLLPVIGGMYLKISEPISLTGSGGGRAKTKPFFHPPHPKSKEKGRFQIFRSAKSGAQSFARFGSKFFMYNARDYTKFCKTEFGKPKCNEVSVWSLLRVVRTKLESAVSQQALARELLRADS